MTTVSGSRDPRLASPVLLRQLGFQPEISRFATFSSAGIRILQNRDEQGVHGADLGREPQQVRDTGERVQGEAHLRHREDYGLQGRSRDYGQ
jgi:hypothetical protein